MQYAIRRARPRDLPKLAAIERRAGEQFAEIGLQAIADDEPTSIEELESARTRGHLWVADHDGEPVGFALVCDLDGVRHLHELSVHPDHGRVGLGSRLVELVCEEARQLGHGQVTLTTYRDVPWNGPFYRRLGFEPMAEESAGPELARLRLREIEEGLDVRPREILRRSLATA